MTRLQVDLWAENNLAATIIVSTTGKSTIINGRVLKSINPFITKEISKKYKLP
jgi:hypothetical protein